MAVTHLDKGDEVWDYRVERWGELLREPLIRHGVVTGGGEIRLHVTWDGEFTEDRWSRPRLQRMVYATKRDALEGARRELEVVRIAAVDRMNAAVIALGVVQELLESSFETIDLQPCGCPVDLPEGHQEGCVERKAAEA